MIVVAVPAVAPFARFFQIVAAGLRLAAMFTVLALCISQPALRIADSLLALSVVVPVHRPRGRWTGTTTESARSESAMRSAGCEMQSASTVNIAARRKPAATIWKKRANGATAGTATTIMIAVRLR